jgi:RimJ/RimL family protein N-acetyltransferase
MSVVVETARLMLRPLVAGDAGVLVRELNNYAVVRWTSSIPYPYGYGDALAFIAHCAAAPSGSLHLAIARKDGEGRLCGVVSVERRDGGEPAELGYWLAESQWGRGIGKEAARAVTGHAFAVAGHDRLAAGYRHGNAASRRILEGLGFVATGDELSFSRAVGAAVPITRLALRRDACKAAPACQKTWAT